MPASPLKCAFWTLSTSIGLSIALLAVGTLSITADAPPTAALTTIADRAPASSDAAELTGGPGSDATTDRQSDPLTSPEDDETTTDLTGSETERPDRPSIPVNLVSHPDGSALAIGLEEALHPSAGDGTFVELPPPPEFGGSAPPDEGLTHLQLDIDELLGQVQASFDGLHSEVSGLESNLDRLHTQFVGLQDRFLAELAAINSAHGETQRTLSELVQATTAQEQPPSPIELDVTIMLMPLRGDARQGALSLISSRVLEADLPISRQLRDRTRCTTSRSHASTLRNRLQVTGQARVRSQAVIYVDQQTVGEINLPQFIESGMTQARGSRVRERIITLPWDGKLAICASSTPSGLLNVAVAAGSTHVTAPLAEWNSFTMLPGGTLIVAAGLDEVERSTHADSVRHDHQQASPWEMIVLIQPRFLTTSGEQVPVNAAATPPKLRDQSTTR